MSLQTPRHRVLQRPSAGSNSSGTSPNLTSMHRKASYNALVGQTPQTPASKMSDSDFSVGDTVNVPGDMYGTVRFVGNVRGKQGQFLGVELSKEFSARGKNDGDVDGVQYFETSIPGSGIFLPVHRAEKRDSPAISFDSMPPTPNTPSYATYRGARPKGRTPPTTTVPKFSQSVGPGARPPSPQFKKPRPSLPRPESPLRKAPNLQPTPARNFSTSQRIGSKPPASPAPGRAGTPKLSASTRTPVPNRPYSRTGSRLGQRTDSADNVGVAQTRTGGGPSFSQTMRSPSRLDRSNDSNEVQRLQSQLEEKDRQLQEQAAALTDMETSLKEIQTLMPSDRPEGASRKNSGYNPKASEDVAELQDALHESKNKMHAQITEFDAHREDFRSTIDTLQQAAEETTKFYERQIVDLQAEIGELREMNSSREEVESIATQLKMLEEVVAELEEGLEDARRGEAEARGEVEFLRGEVERGRSELRREREKAKAASSKGAHRQSESRDAQLEMKDDEIRGLKAIIHSLQAGANSPDPSTARASSRYSGEPDELKRMQASLQQLEQQNAELENQLRREREQSAPTPRPRGRLSDAATSYLKAQSAQKLPFTPDLSHAPASPNGNPKVDQSLWCDACETHGHDLLACKSFGHAKTFGADRSPGDRNGNRLAQGVSNMSLAPKSPGVNGSTRDASPLEMQDDVNRASTNGGAAADKWCALCEQDGHLAFDCPNEQY